MLAPARTRHENEPASEFLEVVRSRRSATTQAAVIDGEDSGTAEGIDLPRADLSHEELTVAVIAEQLEEFTCASCFLVRYHSELAYPMRGTSCGADCEG